MGFKFELFSKLKKKDTPKEHPAPVAENTAAPGMMPNTPSGLPEPVPSPGMGQTDPQMSQLPAGITGDINALVAKGTSEADMVKELKAKGYNFKDIDNALGQVIKSQVSGENLSALAPEMSAEQPAQETSDNSGLPPDFSQQLQHQEEVTRSNTLEAMIESVVEERLASFKTMIDKITGSIDDIREEIDNLDTSLKMVETRTDSTVSDIKKEMDILRDDFSEVSPKVSSIEKAFQDVVPNLVGAISEVNEKLHIKSKEINTESLDLEPDVKEDSKKDKVDDKDDIAPSSEKHEDESKGKDSTDKDDDESIDKESANKADEKEDKL
ncbi:MAG: hypothetical protein KAS11_03260 [Candidatus Aenigmarchaeota archaeon]|nr:hypothetical protein [Candidatus Aenigmarchaeota archaeon]